MPENNIVILEPALTSNGMGFAVMIVIRVLRDRLFSTIVLRVNSALLFANYN